MTYDVIIGIETHIQLNTRTKMFCRCSTDSWQAAPNTHVCPVCLGLPGALPVLNKAGLDKALLVGLALHAQVQERAKFDRKNYFYPDLAKGYQISQFDQPLHLGGYVEVLGEKIGLTRAHLEEDVGKLTHEGDKSLVDFNKAGTPLLEIVSEPVIHSAASAKAYVQTLRQLMRYIGVNEGNLEKGTMRADVNISLQEPGKWHYASGAFTVEPGYAMNNRVEVKNLNSFRHIERAIIYEIERQTHQLGKGDTIAQETRGWDDPSGKTTLQRSKEEAHDYRYFPEPDLPPLQISPDWIASVLLQLPELPADKLHRFMEQYGLSDYDAQVITEERPLAEWFEEAVRCAIQVAQNQGTEVASKTIAKTVLNWMMGELAKLQNDRQIPLWEANILPAHLAEVMWLVDEGRLSTASAKEVLGVVFEIGIDPQQYVAKMGLTQLSATADLEPIVDWVIASNTDAVAKYLAGKESSMMFLVGQVMKETQGRAKPDVVKNLLTERLKI